MSVTADFTAKLTALDVEALAKAFVDELREVITPEEFHKVLNLNRRYVEQGLEGVCASHDVIDANEVMAAAMERLVGEGFNPCDYMEAYSEVQAKDGIEAANASDFAAVFTKWNEAWAIATPKYLTSPVGEPAGTIMDNLQAILDQIQGNPDYDMERDCARDIAQVMGRLDALAKGIDGTGTADAIGLRTTDG